MYCEKCFNHFYEVGYFRKMPTDSSFFPCNLFILSLFQCKDSVLENDRWSSVEISNTMKMIKTLLAIHFFFFPASLEDFEDQFWPMTFMVNPYQCLYLTWFSFYASSLHWTIERGSNTTSQYLDVDSRNSGR